MIWFSHGSTFTLDELFWLMGTPNLDLSDALQPHNGHLIFVSRVLYKLILETVGTDYLTFRLLGVGAAVLTAALLFAYVSRRISKLVALAPALVLLFFGSDYVHLLTGNAFTVLGSVACGLGALLLIERGDRAGDAGACALLCVGVATYSVALTFVAGIAVGLLIGGDRWRRIWVVILPAVLYGAWWLYAQGLEGDPQSQTTLVNLLTLPSWAFQSLSSMLGAVTGLDFDFGGDSALRAGPTLAVIAFVALGWRLSRGRIAIWFWGAIGVVVSLWVIGVLAAGFVRQPDNARYLTPLMVSAFLVAAWAAAGTRWTRGRLICLFVVAALGVLTNIDQLRVGGDTLRAFAQTNGVQLGALDLAGSAAAADTDLVAAAEAAGVSPPYTIPGAPGSTPVDSYNAFRDRYGAIGFSAEQIRAEDETQRTLVDSILVEALGIAPRPAGAAPAGSPCQALGPGTTTASIPIPGGANVNLIGTAGAGELLLRRFADSGGISVGPVSQAGAQELQVPADGDPDPWQLSATVPIKVCGAG
jgi:hypothetical protein